MPPLLLRLLPLVPLIPLAAGAEPDANDGRNVSLRFLAGIAPSYRGDDGRLDTHQPYGIALQLISAGGDGDIRVNDHRLGGIGLGIELPTAGASGRDHGAVHGGSYEQSGINLMLMWNRSIPHLPDLHVEIGLVQGFGEIDYRSDLTHSDDIYNDIAGRVAASWIFPSRLELGLDLRWQRDSVTFDSIDGAGRKEKFIANGLSAQALVGVRF